MMRWIVLALVVVALSAAGTLAVGYLPSNSAEIASPVHDRKALGNGPFGRTVVDDTNFNFGTMAQMSAGEHTWVVRNEGQGPLNLEKGPSTCSCTIANLAQGEKASIPPGGETKIRLTWETKMNHGPFEKSAAVYVHNDPDRSELNFSIEGIVMPALVTLPEQPVLNYGQIPNDEPQRAALALSSPDRPDLKIESIKISDPARVAVTYKPLTEEEMKVPKWKSGYHFDFEIKPAKSLGSFQEEVTIRTDHPKQKELVVVVSGKAIGPVSLYPEVIRVVNISPREGGKASAKLWVRGRDNTSFTVAEKPANVNVEITPTDMTVLGSVQGRQYNLTVTVPPGTPAGQILGSVVLKTDDPRAETVKVPIDLRVLEGR